MLDSAPYQSTPYGTLKVGRLLALSTNFRLGCKWLPVTNELGYNTAVHKSMLPPRGRCNDIQHNVTQHNDIQHNDTQQNDTQQNDTHINDNQRNNKLIRHSA